MAQLGYSTQPLGNKLLPSRVTESLSTLLPCKSQNDRLLATVSDSTARLWNLDTNLPVGPPLQHKERVLCTALSDDGTVLVTGGDKDVYAWDIHAILKKAGLEDLLPPHVAAAKSPMNRNATRRPPIHARQIPPGFFDGVRGDIHSSTLHGVHSPSSYRVLAPSIGSARALFSRIPSFFRRSHSQFQQTPKQGIFSPLDPRTVEVAAVQDKKSLFVAPRPREMQQQSKQSHSQGSSSQSQPAATATFTTQPAQNTTSSTQATTDVVPTVQSRLLTLLARLVLVICCAPLPSTDSH